MLNERQEEYLQWSLTPASLRVPADKKAFAEYLGVSRQALYRWEKLPAFRRAFAEAQASLGISWFADVVGALKGIVDDVDSPARDVIGAARLLLPLLKVSDHVDEGDSESSEDVIARALEAIQASRKEE